LYAECAENTHHDLPWPMTPGTTWHDDPRHDSRPKKE